MMRETRIHSEGNFMAYVTFIALLFNLSLCMHITRLIIRTNCVFGKKKKPNATIKENLYVLSSFFFSFSITTCSAAAAVAAASKWLEKQ